MLRHTTLSTLSDNLVCKRNVFPLTHLCVSPCLREGDTNTEVAVNTKMTIVTDMFVNTTLNPVPKRNILITVE